MWFRNKTSGVRFEADEVTAKICLADPDTFEQIILADLAPELELGRELTGDAWYKLDERPTESLAEFERLHLGKFETTANADAREGSADDSQSLQRDRKRDSPKTRKPAKRTRPHRRKDNA